MEEKYEIIKSKYTVNDIMGLYYGNQIKQSKHTIRLRILLRIDILLGWVLICVAYGRFDILSVIAYCFRDAVEYYGLMPGTVLMQTIVGVFGGIYSIILTIFMVAYLPNRISKFISRKYDEYLIGKGLMSGRLLSKEQFAEFCKLYEKIDLINGVFNEAKVISQIYVKKSIVYILYEDMFGKSDIASFHLPKAREVFAGNKIDFSVYDEIIDHCAEKSKNHIDRLKERFNK
ncbi:MAG: hypothetical protein J6A75_13340 [Lachnospiraceae bacterium]|nr:hypothetical protein [Lachnospiraceae bacterium]